LLWNSHSVGLWLRGQTRNSYFVKEIAIRFDFFKMRAIFKLFWVRKLIGKLGVPYNRRLRVRGSPHPFDYEAGLSLAAAESNASRKVRVHVPALRERNSQWRRFP